MSPADTVVVTGAGKGIGTAIAHRLAADGRHVWCVDVLADRAEETARALREAGGEATGAHCDVGDPGSVTALWDRLAVAGPVSGLVNNAAVFPRGAALEIGLAEWQQVLAVNLTGAFLMCQAFARQASGSGAVVNVASGQAFRPLAGGAHYAAAKAGLVNLGRVLALEWGPLGLRVNTLVPGLVPSDQSRAAVDDAGFAAQATITPLGRLATPAEVAEGAATLLSASFVTGQVLVVDGGVLRL
ncbi:D-threitol dehydrogenase [Pseudonocardia halophobica]|uniref:D-threitol dehydrogenase n=1 Tax=Pseudonocardia halophobica TaxID=29401 RepID=A0A9W6L6A7_9PSEU|nr:SDR family NAD(P)-dependent oxidoreductase [Pseudonocardia halophobica]GLL14462.1 D-threitol dehydrogenase [Pseudonocardia halophobica]